MIDKHIYRLLATGIIAWSCAFLNTSSVVAQTIILPDFQVDNAPAGAVSMWPAIQALPNGNFVVVWDDARNTTGQIYASIYNQLGNIVRDDYRIDDSGVGTNTIDTGSGCITADSNGNFFVTYINTPSYTGLIRKFLPNGDPAGPSVNIRESGATPDQLIKVAKGKDNRVIVVYGASGNKYYRFFDNNLAPLTGSIQVNQTEGASSPALAADNQGNFVVSWRQSDSFPLDGLMRARLFDPDGNPRTDEFIIETFMTGGSEPQATYNKYGHFMIVWWGAFLTAFGRVFDSNGNPLSDLIQFGRFWEANPVTGYPVVEADDAGNFVVAYEFYSDSTPSANYATMLDTNGNVIESFFKITQWPSAEWDHGLDIGYIGNGKFVAVYNNWFFDPNYDIYAVIFQNNHWIPTGTDIPFTGSGALAIIALVLAYFLKREIGLRQKREVN